MRSYPSTLPGEAGLTHRLAAAREARRYLVEELRFRPGDILLSWVEEDICHYEREMSDESHRQLDRIPA